MTPKELSAIKKEAIEQVLQLDEQYCILILESIKLNQSIPSAAGSSSKQMQPGHHRQK